MLRPDEEAITVLPEERVADYIANVRQRQRLFRRVGYSLTVLGLAALVHGATVLARSMKYLRQSPPESLPAALAGVELFLAAVLLLAGLSLARWNRGDAS